jgi:hypothetical protein
MMRRLSKFMNLDFQLPTAYRHPIDAEGLPRTSHHAGGFGWSKRGD